MTGRRLSRRGVLIGGGLAGLSGLAVSGCSAPDQTGRLLRSAIALPEPFTVPLPLPVRADVRRIDGEDVVDVEQQRASLEIVPGYRTDLLTYGGAFPGLLVESRSGTPMRVRHTNRLGTPTVTHLHGGHTPADSDGYPTDLVADGETRDYAYPMTQRAATLWYHDHTMDRTGLQVYSGLLGVHLVRDDEEDALGLPAGDRELPLVVCDRSFDGDGQLAYPLAEDDDHATAGGHDHGPGHGGGAIVDDRHVAGVLGDVVLVNGAPWPEVEVDATRYRLRLLNGCSARLLDLALDPPPSGGEGGVFAQVGSDGGLLERVVTHDRLPMAQAERFDVVVDFSRWPVGSRVTLVNLAGSGATGRVMRFVVARRAGDDSTPVASLGRLSDVEPLAAPEQPTRIWRFTRGAVHGRAGWVVNGRYFDPARMDAVVPLGRVERWRFVADMHHPVHAHLDPFQVLSRAGRSPLDTDAGWKDTVSLRPGEHVDVAVRFTRYAGRYVLHCHNLEHEDWMMMAAYETV
ncbi:multicopper oxidase domain-containing protein [Microvirga sp. 0TCS3.31]